MRAILVLLLILVLVAIVAVYTGFLNVSQTRPGALPKVAVEGGQAPKFDVQTANVSVTNTTETVKVPHLNVEKPR
jgi:beta-lactam-binding protein with PASTA domain